MLSNALTWQCNLRLRLTALSTHAPRHNSGRTMPRIQTTRTVTIALYALRIYLLVMLVLILVKFMGFRLGNAVSLAQSAQRQPNSTSNSPSGRLGT